MEHGSGILQDQMHWWIQGRLSEVAIGECEKPMWVISKKKKYTSSETWEEIRMKKQVVDWWQIRWFPLTIHKQAFVT